MTDGTWYVLVCRECGNGGLPMPFESAEARGKWASDHTRATGHSRWFVADQREGEPNPARRLEDRNCSQAFDVFPDGATLAELEAFIGQLRERGAPDDARPRVKLNEHGEISGIVCLTERHPELNDAIDRGTRP